MSYLVNRLVALQSFLFERQLKFLSKLISVFVRIIFSCQISPGAKFGSDCVFGYGGLGLVIHGDVVCGNRVTFGTNVTIGGNFGSGGVPVIADDVYIATGAKIFGCVKIGSNSIIGANAVVTSDVPKDCVFAGVPGRVIRNIQR